MPLDDALEADHWADQQEIFSRIPSRAVVNADELFARELAIFSAHSIDQRPLFLAGLSDFCPFDVPACGHPFIALDEEFLDGGFFARIRLDDQDRKSTRLNSSH